MANIKWFLPQPRPGDRSQWRLARTSTKSVNFILSFRAYYARLAELFAATPKDATIFMAAWGMTLEQRLDDPARQAKEDSKEWPKTLGGAIQAALKRGVNVRLLVSKNQAYDPDAETKTVKRAADWGANARFDAQVVGTHHQKAVYISSVRGSQSSSFGPLLLIGGMDVFHGHQGWLDAQAEIEGDGADLGRQTLEERWRSVVGESKNGVRFAQRALQWVPKQDRGPPAVQFVRTYGEPGKTGRTYAPDHSYVDLILQAIGKTERFIYIEDQFFWPTPKVTDALAKAVNQNGITLVVIADRPDGRSATADDLRRQVRDKKRLVLLKLKDRGAAFVHSKVWIFDDEMAIAGSANYWDRSLIVLDENKRPLESEFGAAIVGPTVTPLRLDLWRRFPGAPSSLSNAKDFVDQVAILVGNRSPFEPL